MPVPKFETVSELREWLAGQLTGTSITLTTTELARLFLQFTELVYEDTELDNRLDEHFNSSIDEVEVVSAELTLRRT